MEIGSDRKISGRLDLLLMPYTNLNQIAAVIDPVRAANRVLGREAYSWRLSSPDGRPVRTTAGIDIGVEGAFDGKAGSGPVFVLASYRARGGASRSLLTDLRLAASRRRLIVGVETGAWILAEAGLLHGIRATTHWEYIADMAEQFPETVLVEERFVIDWPNRRATTAGSVPTLDFMLSLVQADHGFDVAREVARLFLYETDRLGTSPRRQSLPRAPDPSLDARVASVISMMETHLEDTIPVPILAAQAGISPRRLQSLFLNDVGQTPLKYYKMLRLAQGRRLLEETTMQIGEIALACGYASATQFSGDFARSFEKNPGDFRASSRNVLA